MGRASPLGPPAEDAISSSWRHLHPLVTGFPFLWSLWPVLLSSVLSKPSCLSLTGTSAYTRLSGWPSTASLILCKILFDVKSDVFPSSWDWDESVGDCYSACQEIGFREGQDSLWISLWYLSVSWDSGLVLGSFWLGRNASPG